MQLISHQVLHVNVCRLLAQVVHVSERLSKRKVTNRREAECSSQPNLF